jgi:hypothetical protein
MYYIVCLLDGDGYPIKKIEDIEGLMEAKTQARYLLSDDWAYLSETTHERLDTHKVEILDEDGDCIWDKFREE